MSGGRDDLPREGQKEGPQQHDEAERLDGSMSRGAAPHDRGELGGEGMDDVMPYAARASRRGERAASAFDDEESADEVSLPDQEQSSKSTKKSSFFPSCFSPKQTDEEKILDLLEGYEKYLDKKMQKDDDPMLFRKSGAVASLISSLRQGGIEELVRNIKSVSDPLSTIAEARNTKGIKSYATPEGKKVADQIDKILGKGMYSAVPSGARVPQQLDGEDYPPANRRPRGGSSPKA